MIAALACVLLAAQGLELRGKITDVDGRALSGAHVFIANARPRRGVGTL